MCNPLVLSSCNSTRIEVDLYSQIIPSTFLGTCISNLALCFNLLFIKKKKKSILNPKFLNSLIFLVLSLNQKYVKLEEYFCTYLYNKVF